MTLIDDIKKLDLSKYERPYKPRRARTNAPTQHPTKTCAAILAKYRALGFDLPSPDENYRIHRIHAGHHQRSGGAWSWSLMEIDPNDGLQRPVKGYGDMGSRWPASVCIKEDCVIHTSYGNSELIPKNTRRV